MSNTGEKTEKATPKKRRDARERGQVMRSTEINTAISLIVMFGFLKLVFTGFLTKACEFFALYLSPQFILEQSIMVDNISAMRAYAITALQMAGFALPVFLVAMLTGVGVNLAQVGFLFTTKALQPNFSRINPLEGFKRLFSTRSLVELVKSLIKVAAITALVYNEYVELIWAFPAFMEWPVWQAFLELMDVSFNMGLRIGIMILILSLLDYLYQWWKYEKDLMMTKQEVKDEYKQVEGSPEIRGRIRSKQRQMSAMRMMERVPEADVVITNPTHYAVAIRYKQNMDGAPVVLAKGIDHLARKIRETAAEHRIEIVENKPVAQALYQICGVGDEIPEELYQAVADILVYVYKIKNRM